METSSDLATRIAALEDQVQDLRTALLRSTLLVFRVASISAMPNADDKDQKLRDVDELLAEIVDLVNGNTSKDEE